MRAGSTHSNGCPPPLSKHLFDSQNRDIIVMTKFGENVSYREYLIYYIRMKEYSSKMSEGKDMNYKVITISREYGTHGHVLAEKLSKRLGLPYYDKDFVRQTFRESGIEKDVIDEEGEQYTPATRFIEMVSPASLTSTHDEIFKAQSRVVLELSQNPCIIVGRCANYVLKEAGIKSFDIFLAASEEWRMEHAMDAEKIKKPVTKEFIRKQDAERRRYYKTYTGQTMGNADNYSLCIDVSKIDMDKCVDIICELLK